MRVIGAGLGGTGTLATKSALEILGFGPCYHIADAARHPHHIPLWLTLGDGKLIDWDDLFAGYDACIDFPACIFYSELLEAYPASRIILTERDPALAYDRVAETIYALSISESGPLPPDLRRAIHSIVWERTFGGAFEDRSRAIEVFNRWRDEVQRRVPADRLLVYNVDDGWEPLCAFLGVSVPPGSFPDGDHTHARQVDRTASKRVPRAIVFDYGDTLGDLSVARDRLVEAYRSVRRMLKAEAYRDIPDAPDLVQEVTVRVIRMVNESYQRQEIEEMDVLSLFEQALGRLGLDVPGEMVQTIAEIEYRAMVSERSVPPTTLRTLEALRARGLKLGIVSNAHFLPSLMREDFERLGLSQRVDAIVISSEVGLRKPDPAIFGRVLEALEVTPQETVFVGDKLREDICGPKALGMRAVLTHEYRQEDPASSPVAPDLVIESFADLLAYVDSLRGRVNAVG